MALVLVSAGQPLFTEDAWWHLSMGERYAAAGPWLDADPLLSTATGAPAPAAWLTGLILHVVERLGGVQGLRVLHATLVAGILWLAWWLLRRASGMASFASLATATFAAISAYRLFQLRPHLFTIAASLLLFWLLVDGGRVPSWRRVAVFVAGMALWTNLHGAFVLGPILVAAAIGGLAVAAFVDPVHRTLHVARAKRMGVALVLGLLATLANPKGFEPHLLYFVAGQESPALEIVQDEWTSVPLFSFPTPNVPPSPLSWIVVWALLAMTPFGVLFSARDTRRDRAAGLAVDPALAGIAAVSLAGLVTAVRLLWMAIFPLLLLGQILRTRTAGAAGEPTRRVAGWVVAVLALLLLPGFARLGDWPMISRMVRPDLYASPYPAAKYYAHAVWFMHDAGLEGRLYNDYASGNFLGYWLTPRLRVFVNGSLNVPKDVMDAHTAIQRHEGARAGESFEDVLDRYGIDVFFGTGLPQLSTPGRPSFSTTAYLEGADGWIPVFRDARSAVYVRDDARNRANLERVADYYARQGVPFDPRRGFDPARVVLEAPGWAVSHGLVPRDFHAATQQAHSFDPEVREATREYLASVYAALGLYEQSIELDRRVLSSNRPALPAARRLVWALLRLHRYPEAAQAAEDAPGLAASADPLSRLLVTTAREAAHLHQEGREVEASTRIAQLPVFTLWQVQYLLARYRQPDPRTR